MGFVDRAKSMHARGDAVRAAVILAQGLKRDPKDAEAVGWLLHLYVEELPNPGIEADLLQVLSMQPNGADLLAIVRAELDELGLHAKRKALDKTLDHTPLQFASGPPPGPEPVASVAAERPASHSASELAQPPAPRGGGENWESFDSPFGDGTGETAPQATAAPAPVAPSAPAGAVALEPEKLPEPALADRELSASIDLALSQPLSALDTTTSSFKHDYLDDSSKSKGVGFWSVIAGVAIVCGVLIVGYLQGTRPAEAESTEWEAAPVEDGSSEADEASGEPAAAAEAAAEPESETPEPAAAGSADAPPSEGEIIEAPQDGEGE